MPKFFVGKNCISDSKVILTGADINHIIKVLRMNTGSILSVSDGDGTDYTVKIVEVCKDKIIAEILDKQIEKNSGLKITLYQSVPKTDKMETIIQKCTELGIYKIVPFISEHTVVNIKDKDLSDKKLERWRKIAKEACKQCRRSTIPIIDSVCDFQKVLDDIELYDLNIFSYEKADLSLKHLFNDASNVKNASIIVGPEGGFAEIEAQRIINKGVKPISLGKRILRTETAGMAVLCIIMYELGDMG